MGAAFNLPTLRCTDHQQIFKDNMQSMRPVNPLCAAAVVNSVHAHRLGRREGSLVSMHE